MRATQRLRCYSDLQHTIKTDKLELTPENTCKIFFSIWGASTTILMDAFCRDQKTFMLIWYASYNYKSLWLVAQYEPHRTAPKSAPTISTIKTAALKFPFWDYTPLNGIVNAHCNKRLDALQSSVIDSLPKPYAPGIYELENPVLFQAQVSDDRTGFYKNNIRGQIIGEKSYGYCSMVFSVVAVFLE